MSSLSEIRKTVTTWYDARRDLLDDTIGTDHPAAVTAILTGAAIAAVGLLAGLFWLFAAVIQSVTAMLDHLAANVHNTPAIRTATHLVATPIRDYLTTHAAGTGLSTELVQDSWLLVGAFLALFAVLESRGARIGWALYGAANVAMTWLGTDVIAHRPIAAGLTALTWSLISIFTLHRIGQRTPTVIIRNVPTPQTARTSATRNDKPNTATTAILAQDPTR